MYKYLFGSRVSSLRSEPLGAKIYAKKAASTGFTRSGGEPLASLADACRVECSTFVAIDERVISNEETKQVK